VFSPDAGHFDFGWGVHTGTMVLKGRGIWRGGFQVALT